MPKKKRKNSVMAGVWRRLKRNKLAMVSLGFLIFIVIVAI